LLNRNLCYPLSLFLSNNLTKVGNIMKKNELLNKNLITFAPTFF
jgi:hypothetical protein